MSRLRVISVWVVAVSAILIVYRVYNRMANTPIIEPPGQPTADDLPKAVFGENGSRIGPATVGQAENARYTFVDEQTKEVKRVFGFQKLLNPDAVTRQWNLQKPYMSMHEEAFDCRITADRGMLAVETVKGNPSPTDGQLYENVVIRISAKNSDQPNDSVIYLDQLDYNSERSEFSTKGPLRIVSPQAEMEGRGMLLIYNPGLNRIEFLKVVELDYLRLKDVESLSSGGSDESAPDRGPETASVDRGAISPPTAPAAAVTRSNPPAAAAGQAPAEKPAAAAQSARPTTSNDDLYVCTFSRDVVIAYGGQVTVQGSQEIVVNNILWKSSSPDEGANEPKTDVKKAPAAESTIAQTSAAEVQIDSPSTSIAARAQHDSGTAMPTGAVETDNSAVPATSPTEAKPSSEVYITCKGGFVAKPLNSVFEAVEPSLSLQLTVSTPKSAEAEKTPVAEQAAARATASEDRGETPAHFKAKRISYDMTSGYALAAGPIQLTFYPASDGEPDPNATVMPMVVTAERNAEFFANADRAVERIVFNENVVGTRKVLRPEYVETSSFHGQTLTTYLETDKRNKSNGELRQISVSEGNVKLESIRTADNGDVVSHVRLACLRIDYDAVKSIVYAAGPGNIQLNNEKAPPRPAGTDRGNLSLSGPCFALVRGFDKLTWFTEAMQINADGKEESLHLAYWPVEADGRGQIVRGSTTHLQANFRPLPDGANELATVITAGGIYYEEVGGNIFMGEDLLYDAEDGLLVVSSSENNACLLNGALVDRIEYEVNTGNVRSSLASSPGAVTVPVNP